MAKIGIKIANGEFYPILDVESASGKRLTLTTVRDGQKRAQIDFFSNSGKLMSGAKYLGTILLDGLKPSYAEETSITLHVNSIKGGIVRAEAFDEGGRDNVHRLEVDMNTDEGVSSYNTDDIGIERKHGKKRIGPAVPIIIAALIFLATAAVFFFLLMTRGFLFNNAAGANYSGQILTEAAVSFTPAKTGAPPEPPPAQETPPINAIAPLVYAAASPAASGGAAGAVLPRKAIPG